MNLSAMVSPIRTLAFQMWRCINDFLPGGRIRAFGAGNDQISAIIVINLDRQPRRWRRVSRELGRFRTSEGEQLISITRRLAAVDARDSRAVAPTVDVDAMYRIGDQLYVQPDRRLAECFSEDEPVRMTRQEVAVARSHIEAWKAIANGHDEHVLVLEDDIWITPGGPAAIDRGWRAALDRCAGDRGPRLLYLSYSDADGTASRADVCGVLFRPVRGLWFLSGYVLSRDGAADLLRAMPVVGPVDLWMNFRFTELGALALSSPAIRQRHDGSSDNSYSVMPYLARAGIVDAEREATPPELPSDVTILAWTRRSDHESVAMALSMLGLRVRVFDGDEEPIDSGELDEVLKTFNAVVDAPIAPTALAAAAAEDHTVILLETDAPKPIGLEGYLSPLRLVTMTPGDPWGRTWDVLCEILGIVKPVDAFPIGAQRALRLFRDERPAEGLESAARTKQRVLPMDDSPWVLPPVSGWQPSQCAKRLARATGPLIAKASMTEATDLFPGLVETFPGNRASFSRGNLEYREDGVRLVIEAVDGGLRPYTSGAFASARYYTFGRFEAEIRAAPGAGLITGFFLHRDTPRQEIDIEIAGADPRKMLVNVYFNPGDEGTAMGYGYRGSPCRIDLGFDATKDFHAYAIDWRADRIAWLVDGNVVHERGGWDPTPVPHLGMRVHANLWAPRSEELAGRLDESKLPAIAAVRNLMVSG